ncbi:CBS domain-containing protein [Paraburkholderia sp. C35]|uniref:CBS domain-containing protein n=1 Tax=Paraburkholderia sp. C35 TaxID=2126993 RepID=UPI000D69CF0E|nr:CBS domain-containing protein [Paraburkholderia sp. C35]
MSISSVLNWCFGTQRPHAAADPGNGEAGRNERQALLDELQRQAYLRGLLQLTCADVMRKPAITVTVSETIGGALKALDTHHIKLLPVVDAEGRLQGVVTHVDLQPLDAVLPFLKLTSVATAPEAERRERPVTTVMSTQIHSVDAATPLTEVIPLFARNGHHHLPVVEQSGRVVGMLTQADIVRIMTGYPGSV